MKLYIEAGVGNLFTITGRIYGG